MSRVQDTTPWGTLVEMRPPAQEQNLAVVDFFISENSTSAVMIMPESAADNQGDLSPRQHLLSLPLNTFIPLTKNQTGVHYAPLSVSGRWVDGLICMISSHGQMTHFSKCAPKTKGKGTFNRHQIRGICTNRHCACVGDFWEAPVKLFTHVCACFLV